MSLLDSLLALLLLSSAVAITSSTAVVSLKSKAHIERLHTEMQTLGSTRKILRLELKKNTGAESFKLQFPDTKAEIIASCEPKNTILHKCVLYIRLKRDHEFRRVEKPLFILSI